MKLFYIQLEVKRTTYAKIIKLNNFIDTAIYLEKKVLPN